MLAAGHDIGEADGRIGPITRAAIERAEANAGLPVTGRPGTKIFRALGDGEAASPPVRCQPPIISPMGRGRAAGPGEGSRTFRIRVSARPLTPPSPQGRGGGYDDPWRTRRPLADAAGSGGCREPQKTNPRLSTRLYNSPIARLHSGTVIGPSVRVGRGS
ncbi:peptidoglycan-binding domain-containing protein [Breoghania sp. L-A4]|uniref:peptidoglycan-binding domain-containing protein n=1 Tax=Breoghania sp. L-A4 TaxID=2304600 RepID=UPI00320480C4